MYRFVDVELYHCEYGKMRVHRIWNHDEVELKWNKIHSHCQWKLNLLCLGLDLEQHQDSTRWLNILASASASIIFLCNIEASMKMRYALIKLNTHVITESTHTNKSQSNYIKNAYELKSEMQRLDKKLIINLRSTNIRTYQLKVKVIVITLHLDLNPTIFLSSSFSYFDWHDNGVLDVLPKESDHWLRYMIERKNAYFVCLSLLDSYTKITLIAYFHCIAMMSVGFHRFKHDLQVLANHRV